MVSTKIKKVWRIGEEGEKKGKKWWLGENIG